MEPPESAEVWIINLGTELLTGFTQNTNSAWLARKLTFLGYSVKKIIVVPDEYAEFAEELIRGIDKEIGIIVTTGGLGPTYDDSTLSMISKALSIPLVLNEKALEMVRKYYEKLEKELTEDRIKMAKMPEGAEPLPNPVGAAPGMILRARRTYIISLPGVPKEMEAIFEKEVEPVLRRWSGIFTKEETLVVKGVMESSLAPYLSRIAKQFPYAYIKSHPRGSEREPLIIIQVLVSSKDISDLEFKLSAIRKEIVETIGRIGGAVEQETGQSPI